LSATRRIALAALALVAFGLGACGGASRERVALSVGRATVGSRVVGQWMSAIAPGHFVPDAPRYVKCVARLKAQAPESPSYALEEECRQRYEELRQRALGLAISAEWLIGEATERGLRPSGADLAAKAHSAESKLRGLLLGREARIGPAQVAAYYEQNAVQFGRPEKRDIDIVERIPTKRAAQAVLHATKRRGDLHQVAIHEEFEQEDLANVAPAKRAILRAIFAATPHTVVGPLPLNKKWCFFEVTSVLPRAVKPLAQVEGSIERRLAAERQRATLADFISAWRKKWIARTTCRPGYVVQKCREYRGPLTPEEPSAFD
jgi:foldase protein PrsA